MKIWAHRGCSQCYPENTLTAFEKAMVIPGLCGIELDIQLTRDGEMVVIHDERVDRTTDGTGYVKDHSLSELKNLHIHTGTLQAEHIPTIREVFDLLAPELRKYHRGELCKPNSDSGIRLNIELKNSVFPYPDMEEQIVALVHEYGIQEAIVYSSFYAESIARIHDLDPEAEIGVLDCKVSDCLYKAKGLEAIMAEHAPKQGIRPALHPAGNMMDIAPERIDGYTVRAWFGGHLYPEKPGPGKMDLDRLAAAGVTDVFLNEPEKYL